MNSEMPALSLQVNVRFSASYFTIIHYFIRDLTLFRQRTFDTGVPSK